jgi:hypothetical protein
MMTIERLGSENQTSLYVSPFPNESERERQSLPQGSGQGWAGKERVIGKVHKVAYKGKWTAGVM